ncbi:MAG: helix-turn-helix transcriptional regulator, partial [Actinomycetes bacterium]
SLVGDRDEEARAAVTQGPGALRAVNQAAVLFAEAVAAGRKGWPEEALHCFTRADALLPTQHWWRRLLRLLALEAAVRDGWGDPVTELRADLSAFETGGDRSLARTSRDLLRQAGVPVRRGRGVRAVPPRLRALGVTSREVDVLALVAEGLTNVEVARRLVLSPRTIDHHVSRLLAKTGSANRGELARVLEP